MRSNKRFQQASPLSSRSLSELAFPARKCRFQFAPPDLQVTERSFDGSELFAGQQKYALARGAATVEFRENCRQLTNGKTDPESAPDETNAIKRLRRKQPVSRRRAWRCGKQSETFVITQRIRADTRSEERRVGKECRSRWSTDH